MTRCTLSPQVRASHSTQFSTRPKEQRGAQPFWKRKGEKKSPWLSETRGFTQVGIFFFSVCLTGRPSSLGDSNYSEIKRHYYGSSLSKPLRRKGGPLVKLHIRKYSGSGQGQEPLFFRSWIAHSVTRPSHPKTAVSAQTLGMLTRNSGRGRPDHLTSVSTFIFLCLKLVWKSRYLFKICETNGIIS